MAVPSLDYFKCDPFEFNFRLHVFGGFWPLRTNVRWKQVLFSIFSFICYFSLTSMIAIQAAEVYTIRNDPVRLTEDLCSIASAYTIVIKSLLVLYKIDLVSYLKDKFTEYKNTRRDPVHVEILENSNRKISMMFIIFNMMAVPCTVFWMLYPGLDSDGHKRVPFPYILPIEEWSFAVWVGMYVYQSLAMVGYLINVLAVDAMFCGFVLRINAHYNIIIENLKSLDGLGGRRWGESWNEEEAKLVEKTLKENVELHKDVLEDIKILEEIYGPPFLLHIGGMITIIGTAIIDFVRIAKDFRFQILQKFLYVSAGLWDTFLYCYYASKMQQKSLTLSEAVYNVPWYHMKPELRKNLMFISFKCQKVPKIKVMHLLSMDLRTFVNVLKISYDLTALLFRAVKE